jgi:hypothetical protein
LVFIFRSTILEGLYKDAVILPEKVQECRANRGAFGAAKANKYRG